jgi:hypothetical protein
VLLLTLPGFHERSHKNVSAQRVSIPNAAGHRAEIGSQIDRIGHYRQTDKRVKERHRIMPADISRETATRHPSYLSAD